MKLIYHGDTYECVSAEKKENEIVIHTGEYLDGEEIICQIAGNINFDEVILEGGTWTEASATTDDVLNALLGVSV